MYKDTTMTVCVYVCVWAQVCLVPLHLLFFPLFICMLHFFLCVSEEWGWLICNRTIINSPNISAFCNDSPTWSFFFFSFWFRAVVVCLFGNGRSTGCDDSTFISRHIRPLNNYFLSVIRYANTIQTKFNGDDGNGNSNGDGNGHDHGNGNDNDIFPFSHYSFATIMGYAKINVR